MVVLARGQRLLALAKRNDCSEVNFDFFCCASKRRIMQQLGKN